ncbi:MAG TPA: glycosyltransferase family 4 protein [Gemmatimonadales bacterium]|nr:glycosyltransferase family 4 protein [Gemmatimonadales bacterium]
MNLGVVVHRFDAGEGTGGYVVELLPRLAAHHQVTLYAAVVRAPVPPGVDVVRVPAVMWRAYSAILSFPAAFAAVRRPHDLVHAQGWVTGRADVVTAHIVMAAWRRAARRAGVQSPPGERWLGGLVERREGGLLRRARRVIAPSGLARDQIARHYGRTQGVTVVHHGFPSLAPDGAAADARQRLSLPRDAPVALYVGDARKGLSAAMAGVAAAPPWHLAIASRSTVETTIDPRALNRIHWLGGLDRVAPAYLAADLLLHPTICDSFGLVVAEAMAAGLPAAVTRSAGISELIEHRHSGWILESGGPADVAAALVALANPGLRRRLGDAARAVALRRGWDVVAAETLAVYQEAAGR